VLLFGPAAAAAGAPSIRLRIAPPATAAAVTSALAAADPRLAPFVKAGRLAVNHDFAAPDRPIRESDELALIAMVSGG